MIHYLSAEQVTLIHELLIQRLGGLAGIRDENLLLSALETPKAAFGGIDLCPSVFEKAAAYLYHLTRNHPFLDGNKRTAYFATILFLETNHVPLSFRKEDLEELVVATAQGKVSKQELSLFIETGTLPVFSTSDVL